MDKLSKEELLAILASKTDKPKKERKKPVLDDNKKQEMLDRLAVMRETVKENREKKKNAVADEFNKKKEVSVDEIFEKKYGSKFDKMTDILTDLNENTKETLKLKKEKVAKRETVKLEVKEVAPPVIKAPTPASAPVSTPVAQIQPKPIIQACPPSINPHQHLLPNRNIFKKGNTRF